MVGGSRRKRVRVQVRTQPRLLSFEIVLHAHPRLSLYLIWGNNHSALPDSCSWFLGLAVGLPSGAEADVSSSLCTTSYAKDQWGGYTCEQCTVIAR